MTSTNAQLNRIFEAISSEVAKPVRKVGWVEETREISSTASWPGDLAVDGGKTLVKGLFKSSQQETETTRSDIDPL